MKPWNLVDMFSYVLNSSLLLHHVMGRPLIEKENVVVLAFIAMFIMWIKVFYWLSLHEETAFYKRLLGETFQGIAWFFLIFFLSLCLFANAIYILDANREYEERLFENRFGSTVVSSLFNQYLLALGEFELDNYT